MLRAVSISLCARWQVAEALREREVARKKAEAEKAALKQAEAEAAARKRAEAVGAPVCSLTHIEDTRSMMEAFFLSFQRAVVRVGSERRRSKSARG